jgi:Outer membrane protein beta-barrel domain
MIKKLFMGAAVAVPASLAPSGLAHASGEWNAAATLSATDHSINGSHTSFGLSAGYDFKLKARVFVGAQGSAESASNMAANSMNTALVGRIGAKVPLVGKLYVLSGIAQQNTAGGAHRGWRNGAGFESGFLPHSFIRLEYHHDSYSGISASNSLVAGVGLRFKG